MMWDNDRNKHVKQLLLDFFIKSKHDWRDREPYEISLREAIEYIDDFCYFQPRTHGKEHPLLIEASACKEEKNVSA